MVPTSWRSFEVSSYVGVPRRPRRWRVGAAILATLLFAPAAYAQSLTTEAVAAAPNDSKDWPALGLKIEGEPPVDRQVLERELSRAVGRPLTSPERAKDGVVILSFDTDATTSAPRVQVRYEPPPDQLLRRDVLTGDASKVTSHIASLVHSLLRQDAGVTIVTPPLPPLPPPEPNAAPGQPPDTRASAPCPPASESATAEPPPRLTLRRLESWRLVAGARFSAFGSAAARDRNGGGRTTGDVGIIGASLQAIAPSVGRLRLGIEGVIDSVDAEASLDSGVTGSLELLYVGVSAMPSFNVWQSQGGFEVNLSGHLGVIRTEALKLSGFTNSVSENPWDIGYRVGLAVDANYWLGEHFAITGAVGLDEVKFDALSFRDEDPADQNAGQARSEVSVWVKQPYLRLGATYRF